MTNQHEEQPTKSLGALLKEKMSGQPLNGKRPQSNDDGPRRETCPHCRTVQYIECKNTGSFPVRRRPEGGFHGGVCFIATCGGCGETLVYTSTSGTDWGYEFLHKSA